MMNSTVSKITNKKKHSTQNTRVCLKRWALNVRFPEAIPQLFSKIPIDR